MEGVGTLGFQRQFQSGFVFFFFFFSHLKISGGTQDNRQSWFVYEGSQDAGRTFRAETGKGPWKPGQVGHPRGAPKALN